MSKTEYDLKAIVYPAMTYPINCTIYVEIKNIQQPRLPPINAARPVGQFKCPLT